MAGSVAQPGIVAQRELPETVRAVAKASIRKADEQHRERIGRAFADGTRHWTLNELSGLLNRDERQLARWKTGIERHQLDACLEAPDVYRAVMVALCALDPAVEVQTTVILRRPA